MKSLQVVFAFFLATSSLVLAQTTASSILGTLTDSTGAVVANARVILTNLRTAVKAETVSTSSGDYLFPLVDVGEYSVAVEAPGFKSELRRGVQVQVTEKVRVDFTLQVGQVTDRVEVTAETAALKTDESTLGNVVEQRRLVELPINGRNVGNFAALQPGVMFGSRGGLDGQSGTGGGVPIPGQTIAIVANGQRETNMHATLDGVIATEARVNTVPFSPSPEAMEEVKVLTGSYSAEYGFNSGAQLIMVMRSGGNDFHGAAYEFLRNDKLDAENYFQNYFTPAGAARVPKQNLRQNQYGGVLSGPVWIPKLYNGRNKTFFMFNYEGRRRSNPGVTGSGLVPSDAMRTGDFSALLNRTNAAGAALAPVLIYDPLSNTAAPTPFPGNIIPANLISSTAKALLSFWQKPQVVLPDPLTGTNYQGVGGQRIEDDQYFTRIDHNISDKDKVMFRYATNIPYYLTVPGASPQFTYRVVARNNNIATQWIHVFSPTIVNEARYGYSTSRDDSFNPRANTNFDLSAIGLDAFRVVNDGNRKLTPREAGLPTMNVAPFLSLAEQDGGNGFDDNRVHQIGDNLSWSFGRHSLKFGGEFRRVSLFRGAANVPRGSFDFTGNLANNGFAAFLLGVPSATNTPEGLPLTDIRQNRIGFFGQDDFKVSKRLTLNLGLRYEFNSAATDIRGLWRSFEWQNGLNNPPVFVPNQIRTVYDFYKPQKNMFMPRIGIAYRPTEAWVVRAGYGIYYNVHQLNNYSILNLNPPLSGSSNFSNDARSNTLVNPVNFLSFSNPFGVINNASAVSANVLNTDNFQPQVNQWSLDVQRRLVAGMVLSVGYVGSKTSHLDTTMERNSPDPAFNTTSSTLQSRRPIQFVVDSGVLRPLTRVRFLDSGGNSSYQGLQLSLQKRFAHGFSFSIAHTMSKTLIEGYGRNETDGYNPNASQNPRNRAADKGRVGFDATHNMVNSFIYEIPMFAALQKGVAGAIFNGWQSNGIITLRTGFPMTVTQGAITNTANVTIRPDRVGKGSVSNPTVNQWYNPDDFRIVSCQDPTIPEACKYGNAGVGILEGPGFANVDYSMFKNFRVSERIKVQFRSEFYNVFNTPQFARPNGVLNTGGGFLPTRNASGTLVYPSQANIARGPGAITSTVSPNRQIQFGLKILF
ncbi:TonB-dependent receptor [Bryobacter aggregatus]|uniref:TonB-dependent receptor n=1 Tax=Bryobacter aggregatus TaxID=360054 RepID=UPI0004E25DF5|nr:TonB-dependent receptor [Bryobacter aggregatus]